MSDRISRPWLLTRKGGEPPESAEKAYRARSGEERSGAKYDAPRRRGLGPGCFVGFSGDSAGGDKTGGNRQGVQLMVEAPAQRGASRCGRRTARAAKGKACLHNLLLKLDRTHFRFREKWRPDQSFMIKGGGKIPPWRV